MSQFGSISGLGIDMGSPASIASSGIDGSITKAKVRSTQHQQRRPRSMQLPESLNQYNDHRRSVQPAARPPSSSSGRQVRIASGQAPLRQVDDRNSSTVMDKSYSASGPNNRTARLGAAVAALGDSAWDSSSSGTTPSDAYSPSERSPQSSASSYLSGGGGSYVSAGSNSLKRSITIRKQTSQPNLSRASTMVRNTDSATAAAHTQQQHLQQQQRTYGPPSPDEARTMTRSKSSMSLASQYASGGTALNRSMTSGSTTLGRTSEIPRSGSRAGPRGRGGGPLRGTGADRRATWDAKQLTIAAQTALRSPMETQITADGKHMVPDGFGGFVEASDGAPLSHAERKSRSDESTQATRALGDDEDAEEQRLLQPKRATADSEQLQLPQPRQRLQQLQAGLPPGRTVRPRSLTVGDRPPAMPALRVGSFYGPNGEERARINEDGRLSQIDDNRRDSIPDSAFFHSEAPSNQSSNASSRSSGPRIQFMASPAVARRENGTSVASSGTHASTADAMGSAASDGDLLKRAYSMRSEHGFRGLSGAERGEAMVSLETLNTGARGTTGYTEGEAILPGKVRTADDESILQSAQPDRRDSVDEDGAGSAYTREAPVRPSFYGHRRQASAPAGLDKFHLNEPSSEDVDVARPKATMLDRHGTLIASGTNPSRRSKDLSRLLGNNNGKLSSSASSTAGSTVSAASSGGASMLSSQSSNATSSSAASMPQAVLEQGRSGKGRVDVDLVLESELVVEGGMLAGRLEIKVRKNTTKDGHLMLSQPKVRVVGFEELVNDDTRHIFYHYATVIDGSPKVGQAPARPYVLHGSPSLSSPEADNRRPLACFASAPDHEGYSVAREGLHSVPFALELPVGKGAKGTYRGKHAVVRYIVIGSVKLKSANGSNRSIAHFYRHIDLYPYLNPAVVLSTSPRPVQAHASKGLFLGGPGKVHLTASLHRHSWVAGQRLYVHLRIDNETSKKVKSLSMALVRTVVLFRPRPEFDLALAAPDDPSETYIDPDACTTSTSRKKICEDVLELGQKGAKGTVTARGWWTGVEAGDAIEVSHNMKLPTDALTIARGRHVEVMYSLKVSVGSSLSSDVSVELPVRIVNFVSLDPPPLKSSIRAIRTSKQDGSIAQGRNAASDLEAPMIERVRSMEALRSPQRQVHGFTGGPVAAQAQYTGRYLPVGADQQPQQMQSTRNAPPRGMTMTRTDDRGASDARKLQHQKSLDFINHAIRSATARRGGGAGGNTTSSNEPSPTGLGIELDEARTPLASSGSSIDDGASSSGVSSIDDDTAVHPSCRPYHHASASSSKVKRSAPPVAALPIVSVSGMVGGPRPLYMPSHAVSVDDADDDSDDEYNPGDQTINLNDESVADIDFVIGSAQVDGGESSPEFSQRRGMETFGGDVTVDEESDVSTDTVTSNDGAREEDDDEFDEEEDLQQRRYRAAAMAHDGENDDAPTPIAKSPPKFAAAANVRPTIGRPRGVSFGSAAGSCFSSASSSSASSYSSSSALSNITPEALAEAQREGKSVVRTRSDLEKRLGRSSTIIRGPSQNAARPVSPSKNAPSPTKSALKGKSSFTSFPTQQQQRQRPPTVSGAPPTMRAKVDHRNSATTASATATAMSGNRNVSRGMKPQQQRHAAPASDTDDVSSESSASPATSASVMTPREGLSDVESTPGDKTSDDPTPRKIGSGLGLQLQPLVQSVDVQDDYAISPKSSGPMSASKSVSDMHAKERGDGSVGMANSASMHTLRGTSMVVPSVRDKIAMLESRKQALKQLTSTGSDEHNAATTGTGSPSPAKGAAAATARATASPSRIARPATVSTSNDPDTPTRVQAAARSFLERNNSIASNTSSTVTSSTATAQPDYLRQMPSVQSFKAPIFR